tara:strand:- start:1050 stop:1214 length:165 start_codon:yes stop_codon:yes gene_type:complete
MNEKKLNEKGRLLKDKEWVEDAIRETFIWAVARADISNEEYFELEKKYLKKEEE